MKIKNLITGKCPQCGVSHVFAKPNLFAFSWGPMHPRCPNCNLNFEKEPGFYWGAMYASYALSIAEMVFTYGLCRLLGTGPYDWINLWAMIAAVLLLAPFNFKMSRLIWLYFIP